jgi:hypothetical protein
MCLKETEKARFVQTAENVQFPEKKSAAIPLQPSRSFTVVIS